MVTYRCHAHGCNTTIRRDTQKDALKAMGEHWRSKHPQVMKRRINNGKHKNNPGNRGEGEYPMPRNLAEYAAGFAKYWGLSSQYPGEYASVRRFVEFLVELFDLTKRIKL